MQIAILVTRSDRSFVVRHMVDLAKDLVLRGHEIRLVSILGSETSGFGEELGEDHICIGAARTVSGVSPLAKLMRSGSPDLIISAGLEANCVAGLSRKMAGVMCPMIFFEQDVPGYDHLSNPLSKRFWAWTRQRTYPLASRIIAPTYEVKRRLLNAAPISEEKIVEIMNPGRGYFSPPIKAPHPWLAEARADPTFVAAGPLDKNSDFATLMDGVSRAQRVLPCKVVILGDGPEKKRLFDFSKSRNLRNLVSFASDVENLHDYVYFSDGFISTALSSACPDVVIRAMELSSRVICTASPGGSREVLGEGAYGKLLRMKDPDAVAYALHEAMQSPKMRPSERDMLRFDRGDFFERVSSLVYEVGAIDAEARGLELDGHPIAIEAA